MKPLLTHAAVWLATCALALLLGSAWLLDGPPDDALQATAAAKADAITHARRVARLGFDPADIAETPLCTQMHEERQP